MHLLVGETGRIDDGGDAIDLGQSPGDIVFLSIADTELATLARAFAREPNGPSLRLANLMQLSHPYSVDLYLEKTVATAKLVVVRMMGGAGYWPYGLDSLRALARAGGPILVVVPGEDRWDAGLEPFSTVPVEQCRALWHYCAEGGEANLASALRYMRHLLGFGAAPPRAVALPEAGFYRSGRGIVENIATSSGRPVAMLVFYRALIAGNSTEPIDALVDALDRQGIQAVPLFASSLKNPVAAGIVTAAMDRLAPDVVLNATAFALSSPGRAHAPTVLDRPGRPVLQVIFAGTSRAAWAESRRGLGPRDLIMNVVLPEVDGRILSRAVSFKEEVVVDARTDSHIVTYRSDADRIAFVAAQAAAWIRLGAKPPAARKIALVLSNYPDRDGRLANGVGLDTPESAARIGQALAQAGYALDCFPQTGRALMTLLLSGPDGSGVAREIALPLDAYRAFHDAMPAENRAALAERWGAPEADPCFADGAFRLAIHRFGNIVVAIQPARGNAIDPKATYHDPDLVPPHHYLAFYAWLRLAFGTDAIVHVGKHGNLEWLPGKAAGLSPTCWPEIALGATPLVYPFIVNDPGEGAQAKRRASAVIVDHLMPPMTRAEAHGPFAELETLIDEYQVALGTDPRRRDHLERDILLLAARHGIDRDLDLGRDDTGRSLRAIDAHLCEIKELQIRDGLHVFGSSPTDGLRVDTLVAIARIPRSGGRPEDASLHRAIAADLGFDGFDPLAPDLSADWNGVRPAVLADLSHDPWRTHGDTVERIELLAKQLVAGLTSSPDTGCALDVHAEGPPQTGSHPLAGRAREGDPTMAYWHKPPAPSAIAPSKRREGLPHQLLPTRGRGLQAVSSGPATAAVLDWLATDLAPALDRSGAGEVAGVLAALDGRFVPPGPSGAPSRGRADVLPTGRNFYSVDIRAVPTASAWRIGKAAAEALVARYLQDEGNWPRSIAISAWGTANMRTGGDDIAQVLALIGTEPVWEAGTGRVTGFRVLTLAELKRPRVDVTLRISGMFRDAFPEQIDLIDSAVRAVACRDEPDDANPIAADRRSGRALARIFGARPGAYGAGLQTVLDEKIWTGRVDLAASFLDWSGFAYGGGAEGRAAGLELRDRLKATDAVLQNQDNREHDILDSDDYAQFQGGLSASAEQLGGRAPRLYHGDHSRPENPVVRPLAEEIGRVVRGRAVNPKWIAGCMRHGYKGAVEMAATLDLLFAYAATTNAVGDYHFDALYDAYLADDDVRAFIADANAPVLAEMAERFIEAIDRGLWSPRANSAHDSLRAFASTRREPA